MARGWGVAVVAMLALCTLAPTAGAASIDVVGADETVYHYDTMSCFRNDLADGPARAIRDASNQVQIWMPGGNTRMLGPDFTTLTHDCTRIIAHHANAEPHLYDDGDWLTGHWTEDGQTIYGLVHAEYHGFRHPGWCPGEEFIKCRYNVATTARSTDGGTSFQHSPGPAELLAAMPYRYVPGDGRYGFFAPSNIVEKDGWFYSALLVSETYREQLAGTCMMRTQNVADPKSWRAWDGDGFNVRFVDPYRESPEPVRRHVCRPVSPLQIGGMSRSLTYNSFLDKFVLVATQNKFEPALGRVVIGFYFSLSDDLVHWTDRKLILEHETGATYICGDPNPRTYPSIIDHDAPGRNFSTTDATAYIYWTDNPRENCQPVVKTNLMRAPIQFTP